MKSFVPYALAASFVAAVPAHAQREVHLQLRPHAGDTLRLRMDQTIEVSRFAGPTGDESMVDAASLVLLARMAVESADANGAVVLALTDSVRITSSETFALSPTLRAARALQGQRIRFQVRPDGATLIAGSSGLSELGLGTMFSQLPATLPKEPIQEGASWVRAMDLPLSVAQDARGTATLNATFRFDSLSGTGEYAYITVRGSLVRSGPLSSGGKGAFVQASGEVSGKILIDLRRGWIADARSVVTLQSLVSGMGNGKPASRVRVKITQWMRVL